MADIKSEKTEVQLNDILTQVAKSQNIENFELNSNTKSITGDGTTGEFFIGEIKNKESGETTNVAIKKAPSSSIYANAAFKNEILFYETVFPALDKLQKNCGVLKPFDNIPKYFCGNLELNKEFIAMENLKLLGYVMFDKTQYFNEEHLEYIFKMYAKFHALSFVLRKRNPKKYHEITKGFSNSSETGVKFMSKPLAFAVSATLKTLNREENKIMYDTIKYLGDNMPELFFKASKYNGELRCFVHADCWSNNMFFKYSEDGKLLNMKIFDFQLARDHTPIYDLSYFFYSGASKKDFEHLDNYLQIYYNTFIAFAQELGCNPEELFSFDLLKNEWKENALLGILFAVFVWQVKLTTKDQMTKTFQENQQMSPEEQLKAFESYGEKMQTSDSCRERTAPIFIHASDYGILKRDKIESKN